MKSKLSLELLKYSGTYTQIHSDVKKSDFKAEIRNTGGDRCIS